MDNMWISSEDLIYLQVQYSLPTGGEAVVFEVKEGFANSVDWELYGACEGY